MSLINPTRLAQPLPCPAKRSSTAAARSCSGLRPSLGSHTPIQAQRGVALFMVLMITLVIVALSVSMASGVFSDQKASRAAADSAIAREAAEAALRDAEHDLNCQGWNSATKTYSYQSVASGNRRPFCDIDPSTQVCEQLGNLGAPQICDTTVNAGLQGIVSTPLVLGAARPAATNFNTCFVELGAITKHPKFELNGADVDRQPRYAVEVFSDTVVGGKSSKPIYRITARGYGRNMTTTVDLESIVRPCN